MLPMHVEGLTSLCSAVGARVICDCSCSACKDDKGDAVVHGLGAVLAGGTCPGAGGLVRRWGAAPHSRVKLVLIVYQADVCLPSARSIG